MKPTGSRRSLLAIGITVALVLMVLVAWRSWPWGAAPPAGTDRTSLGSDEDIASGLTLYPKDKRPHVPDVSGKTLDGDHLSLSDLRGKVVVVNVWGSWCGPCRKEAPDLARLARETNDRSVRFVGIDTRDNPTAAKAFVRHFGIPYPSFDDPDGRVLLELAGIVPISAVPSTLVIDAEGGIAGRVVGRVTYATLRGLVEDTLTEQRGRRP